MYIFSRILTNERLNLLTTFLSLVHWQVLQAENQDQEQELKEK